jgi:hypothetical protein
MFYLCNVFINPADIFPKVMSEKLCANFTSPPPPPPPWPAMWPTIDRHIGACRLPGVESLSAMARAIVRTMAQLSESQSRCHCRCRCHCRSSSLSLLLSLSWWSLSPGLASTPSSLSVAASPSISCLNVRLEYMSMSFVVVPFNAPPPWDVGVGSVTLPPDCGSDQGLPWLRPPPSQR